MFIKEVLPVPDLPAIPIFSFSAAEEVVSSPAGVKKCIASGVKSVNPSTLPFTVTETTFPDAIYQL